LAYFEREHKFYDQKQLMSEITGHYSQQVQIMTSFESYFIQAQRMITKAMHELDMNNNCVD